MKPLVEVAKPETDASSSPSRRRTGRPSRCASWLPSPRDEQSDGQASGSYGRRFLRFDDRRRMLTGYLPADQYAVVKGSLVARASRLVKDHKPFDQRMAEALVAVCKKDRDGRPVAPTSHPGGGNAAEPADRGGPRRPELPGRGRGRRRARRPRSRVARDGAAARLRRQGPRLSRRSGRAQHESGPSTTVPSDAERIEIRRRDKGCRFPGCTHTEFTDVHHVLHWTNGGATDLDNLVELCDQHHRFVHEMGWRISGDASVELNFKSPTGRMTTSTPSPAFRGAARDGPPDSACRARRRSRPATGRDPHERRVIRSRGESRLQL